MTDDTAPVTGADKVRWELGSGKFVDVAPEPAATEDGFAVGDRVKVSRPKSTADGMTGAVAATGARLMRFCVVGLDDGRTGTFYVTELSRVASTEANE